jgi:predicted transposase/invertase (TIGR01784 family)
MPLYHQHEYDLTSKELFKNIEQPLLQYLMKKPVQLLKTLDIQFQHIESQRADLVYEALIEGQSTIVHLELQTENNPHMLVRMLHYLIDIYSTHKKPIYQCVVYLGTKPANMLQELHFSVAETSRLDYRYHILALNQMPFAELAHMEPVDFLALLPLTHSDWDPETHLATSIEVVTERSQGMDFQSRSNLLLKTEVLAGLRFKRDVIERVCKEAMDMFQIEQSSTYQMILEKGIEKGLQEGKREGIQEGRQAGISEAETRFRNRITDILRKRFGPLPVNVENQLLALNLSQLDQALANALEAETLQAFMALL